MRQLSKRTSRRVDTLKDSDYDHEIGLVDEERRGRRSSPASRPGSSVDNVEELHQSESTAPVLQPVQEEANRRDRDRDQFQDAREEFTPRPSQDTHPDAQRTTEEDTTAQEERRQDDQGGEDLDNQTTQPSIAVEGM